VVVDRMQILPIPCT